MGFHGETINNSIWLVVSNMNFIFHNIWDVILPIDFFIFFRGVGQPPTSYKMADFYLNLWSCFQKAKDDQPSNKMENLVGFHPEKNTKTMGNFSHFFGGGWWWDFSPVFGLRVRFFFLGYFRRGYSVSKGWCQYCGMVIILNIFLKVSWHILHASHVLIMAQTTRVAK